MKPAAVKALNSLKLYHYSRSGTPSNLLNLPAPARRRALKWYKQHASKKDEIAYVNRRLRLEEALRQRAIELLGKDRVKVKHPLYTTPAARPAWRSATGARYTIAKELLPYTTFSPGDSFDYLRKKEKGKRTLPELLSSVGTITDIRKIIAKKKLKRTHGNYTEGQVWSPFSIDAKNKIINIKKSK